jgi:Flp pilus assembly protein protease CpaA
VEIAPPPPWQWLVASSVLALALCISVITDLRRRLILNVVTYPALAVVFVCFAWLGGMPLLIESAIGMAVCAVIPLLVMLRGWMAAGDVKLLALSGAVAGAWAGWPFSLMVLLYVSLAGGVQALLWIIAARLRGRERPKYVPYGLSIALGTLAAFFGIGQGASWP